MSVVTLRSLRRLAVRGSLATALAGALVAAVTPTAHASSADRLVCTAGGSVTIAQNAAGTYDWVLSAVGACIAPNHPAQERQATLTGTATTTSLGVCSGTPLVDAFAMNVTTTLVSVSATQSLISNVEHQVWSLPATSFPIVSPFAITDGTGANVGAGEFETHIFGGCPPDGRPAMEVNWVQNA